MPITVVMSHLAAMGATVVVAGTLWFGIEPLASEADDTKVVRGSCDRFGRGANDAIDYEPEPRY